MTKNKRSEVFAGPGNRGPDAVRKIPGWRRRFPVADGIYYPKTIDTLIDELEFSGLTRNTGSRAFGGEAVLAPHGAWKLTGNIAAGAFAAIQKKAEESAESPVQTSGGTRKTPGESYGKVILLGPIHQSNEEGIYLSESALFETPLGNLAVDSKLNHELASSSPRIKINDVPHFSEHSLEVLLPLVKYCFPDVKIVPVLMSGGSSALVPVLARALRIVLQNYMEESLVVISSQISRNPEPALSLSMAEEFSALLSGMNAAALLEARARGKISACGTNITAALLESGLLEGKRFNALSPLTRRTDENGDTVYYRAFTTLKGGREPGPV